MLSDKENRQGYQGGSAWRTKCPGESSSVSLWRGRIDSPGGGGGEDINSDLRSGGGGESKHVEVRRWGFKDNGDEVHHEKGPLEGNRRWGIKSRRGLQPSNRCVS